MTIDTDHEIAYALTNRERRQFIYGEMTERPNSLTPFEDRVQALLDLSDRLLAGTAASCSR